MKKGFLGLLCYLLVACTSYSAIPISDDVYRISLNQRLAVHSNEKIQRYLMLKYCEITLGGGNRYFVILNKEEDNTGSMKVITIKTFRNKPNLPNVMDAQAIYNSIAGYGRVKALHKQLIVTGEEGRR